MDRDFPGKSIGAEAKTPVSDLTRFLNLFMRQLCNPIRLLDMRVVFWYNVIASHGDFMNPIPSKTIL